MMGNGMLLCCFGLGLVTVGLSPFAVSPVLSLLGLPETGLGALWFFDFASVLAGGLYFLLLGKHRFPAYSMALAAIGLAALTLPWGYSANIAPLALPEFAAFAIIPATMVLKRILPDHGKAGDVALAVACVILLALVKNKTAAISFVFFTLVVGLARGLIREGRRGGVRMALAGVAIPLAGALLITVLAGFELLPAREGHSLYSRFEIYRVVRAAFLSDPLRLLTGFGWGGFPHVLVAEGTAAHGTLVGLTDYSELVWEGLREPFFQTFNMFLEAVLSLGLLGLGFLAWVAVLAAGCPPRRRSGLAPGLFTLEMLWVTWFDAPPLVPFLALAFASLAGRRRFRWRWRALPVILLAGAASLQLYGAARGHADIAAFEKETKLIRSADLDSMGLLCSPLFPLDGRGDYYEAALLNKASRDVLKDGKAAAAYLTRMCRVRKLLGRNDVSLPLNVAYVRSLGRLAHEMDSPKWAGPRKFYLAEYAARVTRMISQAPRRPDLAVAYLAWAQAHDLAGFDAVLRRMLAADPSDPVASYYMCSSLMRFRQEEGAGQAAKWMEQALRNGVKRILDPDDELRKRVEAGK